MTPFRVFASLALVAVLTAAAATPAAAQEKPPPCWTYAATGESGAPLAVQVNFNAYIAEPAAGHEYRFLYQFRLHTRKGEAGPILGDAARPTGKAFDLGRLVEPAADAKGPNAVRSPGSPRGANAARGGIEFDGWVDVTRKDLSGMTNLPRDAHDVIVRVEPQVYDATAKTFLTPTKSDAALLFVTTGKDGQVWAVRPFADWFSSRFGTLDMAQATIRRVAELDGWEQRDYEVARGFERVFASPEVKPELKAIAVRGMPARLVKQKNNVGRLLGSLAESGHAELKATAEAKLAEAEKN